jgi:hypothetical protein
VSTSDYPIEVEFPDISPYRDGGSGIPYVHSFDSSMDFRFAGPYTGLETFPEAGAVIGWRDGEPVRTPYPDCVMVMPSLRQLRPGVTVARFGQLSS